MKDNLKKLPSLDGWRAVSIALVLLAHAASTAGYPPALNFREAARFETGFLGVLFFFVISGFLITWLMLQEHEKHGVISLKNFYLRRVLRILPVYVFYLLALGCLTRYAQSPAAWLANLTFTTNFFPTPVPTEHLWSLGVEEQFYLLWPWVLILTLKRSPNPAQLVRMLILPIVLAPLVRVVAHNQWYPESMQWLFRFGSFFKRCDALAYGCLAAVLLAYWRPQVERFFQKYAGGIATSGLLLILAHWGFQILHVPDILMAAGLYSTKALGFALLLLDSVLRPGWGFYRALNWAWVRHFGVLSYSIYIWQQMFFVTDSSVFGVKEAWWLRFPAWVLVALLAAHASYYLMEKPLLRLRAKYRAA